MLQNEATQYNKFYFLFGLAVEFTKFDNRLYELMQILSLASHTANVIVLTTHSPVYKSISGVY